MEELHKYSEDGKIFEKVASSNMGRMVTWKNTEDCTICTIGTDS